MDASTGDDAAVYRLSDERALVVTVDFFSPVVDDPVDFGRIAAANALSDLYAMGARPLFVLNLFAFPRAYLDSGIPEGILEGGRLVAEEAGVPILGGHSIDDPEPKYGMVAIGEAHPERLITNSAARPGDVLVLTKPLGIGIITTALKADAAPPSVITRSVEVMTTLNRGAAEAMTSEGVKAGTDVTGFGLLGHLRVMARASGVAATVRADAVPILEGARPLAEAGHVPGGTKRNSRDLDPDLEVASGVDPVTRLLLCDAQTSGGMLMAVAPDRVEKVLAALKNRAPAAVRIGELHEGPAGHIRIE